MDGDDAVGGLHCGGGGEAVEILDELEGVEGAVGEGAAEEVRGEAAEED